MAASSLTTSGSFASSVLEEHNALRALTGASALTWSNTLAQQAAVLAEKCVFQHGDTNGYGQNLAAGSYTNAAYYVYLWFEEYTLYNFDDPGYSSSTGHFTQVVWESTTQVGCAFATGCTDVSGYDYFLVCDYNPAGNVLGSFGEEVSEPTATATAPAKFT